MPLHFKAKMYILLYEKMSIYLCQKMYKQSYLLHRSQAEIVPWFLNPISDIRSSLFLEDVATEFDIQGLELDWTCLVWDGDFRYDPTHNCWQHFNFRSDRWQNNNAAEGRAYQLNAYRVLLTRARQGMVICIPEGDPNDATRNPEFYDNTYEYFKGLGVEEI